MQRDSRGFFTKRTHTHLYRRYWNVGRWVDGSETVSGWQVVGCCVVGGEQKELHLSTAFQNSIKNLLFSVREHWKLWARVCWLSMGQHDLHTPFSCAPACGTFCTYVALLRSAFLATISPSVSAADTSSYSPMCVTVCFVCVRVCVWAWHVSVQF